jgi:hypothetical protein
VFYYRIDSSMVFLVVDGCLLNSAVRRGVPHRGTPFSVFEAEPMPNLNIPTVPLALAWADVRPWLRRKCGEASTNEGQLLSYRLKDLNGNVIFVAPWSDLYGRDLSGLVLHNANLRNVRMKYCDCRELILPAASSMARRCADAIFAAPLFNTAICLELTYPRPK